MMNTHMDVTRQKPDKTPDKLEWLLARSAQANFHYSRAQMEAFIILQDSYSERLEDINPRDLDTCIAAGT